MSDVLTVKEGHEGLVETIAKEIDQGFGIVPLIGAGFSVPSGSPIIVELEDYLQRCICVALQIDANGNAKPEEYQPWNPRTDQWPPVISKETWKDKQGETRDVERGHWERVMFGKVFRDGGVADALREKLKAPLLKAAKDSDEVKAEAERDPKRTPDEISEDYVKASIGPETNPKDRKWPSNYWAWQKLYSEALGAMKDYRTALLFLSRLEIPTRR